MEDRDRSLAGVAGLLGAAPDAKPEPVVDEAVQARAQGLVSGVLGG